MTRTEFMTTLQRALAGGLNSSSVNENMRYYQDYFDTQLRLGKSEEEITAELGNPRLLAKSIIEAAKREGRNGYIDAEYEEVYEDGTYAGSGSKRTPEEERAVRMPGWLITVLVILVLFVIGKIVGSVIIAFFPILVPAACAVWILKLLQKRG